MRSEAGLTLTELVVTLAIIGILSAAAVPMAKMGLKRSRELELRQNLRTIRRALDDFHRSYVASGGAIPGVPAQPVQPQARPGRPTAGGVPGQQQQQQQQGIPLIDVSLFDPIDSMGYPEKLEQLVEGVPVKGGLPDQKVKWLRRIPRDPMTDNSWTDDPCEIWLCRSYDQDFDSFGWNRKNVYDIRSRSYGTALDGTRYSEW